MNIIINYDAILYATPVVFVCFFTCCCIVHKKYSTEETQTEIRPNNVEITHSTDECNIVVDIIETENLDCSICINTADSESMIMLSKCNHTFHEKCIGALLEYSKELENPCMCPNCRKPICNTCESVKHNS